MAEKYQTLRMIYELVKDEQHPELQLVNTREIILRLQFGWDVIVGHLHELKDEGLLHIEQLNVAMISLTSKGLLHAAEYFSPSSAAA